MADSRLRARERAWREAGDFASEGAYLRERVRLGTLSEARFQLARALGAPALGGAEHPPLGFQAWLDRLPFRRRGARFERDFARVPLALARAFEPLLVAADAEGYPRLLRAVEEAWARGWKTLARDRRALLALREEVFYELRGALKFLEVACDELRGEGRGPEGYEGWARRVVYPDYASPSYEALIEAHFPSGEGRLWTLRLAVRDALLPWALAGTSA